MSTPRRLVLDASALLAWSAAETPRAISCPSETVWVWRSPSASNSLYRWGPIVGRASVECAVHVIPPIAAETAGSAEGNANPRFLTFSLISFSFELRPVEVLPECRWRGCSAGRLRAVRCGPHWSPSGAVLLDLLDRRSRSAWWEVGDTFRSWLINTSNVTHCYITWSDGMARTQFQHLAPGSTCQSAETDTLRHIAHTFERLYAVEQPVLASLRHTKARFDLGHGAQGAGRRATASRRPVGITLRRQFRTIRLNFPVARLWMGGVRCD